MCIKSYCEKLWFYQHSGQLFLSEKKKKKKKEKQILKAKIYENCAAKR